MRRAASGYSMPRCCSGLPQFEKEELLASLLIFRVLYFVLPLTLAVLALGTREAWIALRSRGRAE